ncbi:hypothetical protein BDR07DRAFT_1481380 [Suillus spraguei]|nr:hypothetical protein BDR07DRAFT_1481380 [Suillus spraguei]
MDPKAQTFQTQTSSDSRSHTEERSPSPRKNTFNSDFLSVVGHYRRGTITKTNAILEIFKQASHVDGSEFGGRSVAELVVPYHRMLDSFEKEIIIIRVGEQDRKNEEEASKDGKELREDNDSLEPSFDSDSKKISSSEIDESNSASEIDEPTRKKQRGFKLDLSNFTDPSVVRRSKKLPASLRKTNSILVNWAHDPKRVKRKWLESAFVPEFPESELYNIIRGRVVNFDIIFTGWYSDEPEHDHEDRLGKLKIKIGGGDEPAKSV